ncbi:hypothetical protein F0266_14895 [Vibrio coralliilyticus]|nr:hypothetical protein [Vibrio coralliilyticus]
MKILAGLTMVLLVAMSSIAHAASGVGAGKVKTLLWYEGHTGVLVVQENMVDHGDCGRSDYYILDEKHDYNHLDEYITPRLFLLTSVKVTSYVSKNTILALGGRHQAHPSNP